MQHLWCGLIERRTRHLCCVAEMKRPLKAAVGVRPAHRPQRTSSEAASLPSNSASTIPINWAAERKGAPPHEAVHARVISGPTPDGPDPDLSSVTLIRKRRLAQVLNVNPWTIDRWRRQGKFPEPVWLSDTMPCWRISDVENWVASRKGARPPSSAG
jgi:predicted DNA-binding transcriptional regulator AlpA